MACLIKTLDLNLQVNILSHAPNVETLVSLLKANPRFYQAFSSARNRILTKVLMNTYGAELYADALTAVKVIMLPPKSLSRSEKLSFLNHYHHFRGLTPFPENDLPTSILMCQLHWALNYHVKRFSTPAIKFIITCAKGLCGEEVYYDALKDYIQSTLSSSEQVRLRRGFLRFQIHSRLFCIGDPPDDENRAQFTRRMPPWEVEEIGSVYNYISRSIHQTFDLAEEDFLSAYTTEVGLANTFGGVLDPSEGTFDAGDGLYRSRLKANMLLSGLCFLRRLFESTGEARLALVSSKDDFSCSVKPSSTSPLLDSSIATVRADPSDQATSEWNGGEEWVYVPPQNGIFLPGSLEPVSPGVTAESSQQSTLTWEWAHAPNVAANWGTGIYHELRGWGYVFWDRRRMRYSGIFKQRYVAWWDDWCLPRFSNPFHLVRTISHVFPGSGLETGRKRELSE